MQVCDKETGSAFIMVNKEGENLIIVDSGANQFLNIDLIDDKLLE